MAILLYCRRLPKSHHSLSDAELFRYAPITGLPEFLDLVQGACFGQSRPDGCYTAAVATAGGSGAVHHCIWNYTMPGDTVLTSAWYWGPYKTMCRDMNRNFDTYPMVTEDHRFNLKDFGKSTGASQETGPCPCHHQHAGP